MARLRNEKESGSDVTKTQDTRALAPDRAANATILVAEDDQAVRDFVARALAYYGHVVTSVPDGSAALAALAERRYDLMLTDIVMPGIDGIALAAKANKADPEMPVLMMTGFASEGQRANSAQNAVERVISKPFSLKDICAAVEAALAARRQRMH